jgi:hypothetical protein
LEFHVSWQARGWTAHRGGSVDTPPTTGPDGPGITYGPGGGAGSAWAVPAAATIAATAATANSLIARPSHRHPTPHLFGCTNPTSPSGQTYITTAGSALLFPSLCVPTGALDPIPHRPRCTDRTAMMPKRQRTRSQNRTARITAERGHNQRVRHRDQHREKLRIIANDEPPPF